MMISFRDLPLATAAAVGHSSTAAATDVHPLAGLLVSGTTFLLLGALAKRYIDRQDKLVESQKQSEKDLGEKIEGAEKNLSKKIEDAKDGLSSQINAIGNRTTALETAQESLAGELKNTRTNAHKAINDAAGVKGGLEALSGRMDRMEEDGRSADQKIRDLDRFLTTAPGRAST